LTINYFCIR